MANEIEHASFPGARQVGEDGDVGSALVTAKAPIWKPGADERELLPAIRGASVLEGVGLATLHGSANAS